MVKSQAYKSLVRPTVEYGSSVWDPYREYQKAALIGKRPAESSTLCHQHIWKRDGMRYKGLKKIEMGVLGGEEESSKTDITPQKTK